jgi:hypothetical protein
MTRTKFIKKASYTMHALLVGLTMLASCSGKEEVRTQLSSDQVAFLTVVPTGTSLQFNENGDISTVVVGEFSRYTRSSEPKVGMFSKSVKYYTEYGDISYDAQGAGVQIDMNAVSNGAQEIKVYTLSKAIGSSFYIDFTRIARAVTINGVEYKNVFLGIDSNTKDTLYWKTGLGIIGWKRENEDFTAYRIF